MSESVSGTIWSITINNPTEEDRYALEHLPAFVKCVQGQDEVGKEGTLHYQGLAKCRYTVKLNAVKQWLPRAHLERARNAKALSNYVMKSETAVEGSYKEVMQDEENKVFVVPSRFPRLVVKHFLQYMEDHEWQLGDKNYLDFDEFDYGLYRDSAIDATIRDMIRQGWHIELLAVNPSVMKALKTFWVELLDEQQNSARGLSFVQYLKTNMNKRV